MTFQQLTYLVEISKCGSINKAARKLFLSQSAISTAVQGLEKELGIQFFTRSNRGVEFTPEGKEFLSYAASLLEQKHRIESLYGEVHTAAPERFSVSTQRYPFVEAAFIQLLEGMEDHRYHCSIKETEMDAVIDDVYDHRANLGVICLTDLTEKIIRRLLKTRDIEFHEMAEVGPCIFIRRDHPLAAKAEVDEADLEGYPYLSFEMNQGVATDFFEEYPMASLKKPNRRISVNSRIVCIDVLARTDAYTTGSGLFVEDLSNPAVITVPLKGKSGIRLGWIRSRYSKLTPLGERFTALLERSLADSIRYTNQCIAQRRR